MTRAILANDWSETPTPAENYITRYLPTDRTVRDGERVVADEDADANIEAQAAHLAEALKDPTRI